LGRTSRTNAAKAGNRGIFWKQVPKLKEEENRIYGGRGYVERGGYEDAQGKKGKQKKPQQRG